jgi:hypothetical protein
MKFANPRIVWIDYVYDVIDKAKKLKKELKIYINVHQNNKIDKQFMINETAALMTFDFKYDTLDTDKMIGAFSGYCQELMFTFSIVDIIQISPLTEFEIKVDPKLLERSKQHLRFR